MENIGIVNLNDLASSLRPGITLQCIEAFYDYCDNHKSKTKLDQAIEKIVAGEGNKRVAAIEGFLNLEFKAVIVEIDGALKMIEKMCPDCQTYRDCPKSPKQVCGAWIYKEGV